MHRRQLRLNVCVNENKSQAAVRKALGWASKNSVEPSSASWATRAPSVLVATLLLPLTSQENGSPPSGHNAKTNLN